MNRRHLLKGGIGLIALANLPSAWAAEEAVAFTPEIYEEALASGKPFMLDFYASW